jgi:hypothetical protein
VLFTYRTWNKGFGTRVCVILFPKTPLYAYPGERALGIHLCFMNISTHVCFGNGEEKCTQNFSPETSSKEIILDTQAYRQIYGISANEHGNKIAYFLQRKLPGKFVAWLSD